ncbi:MAG: poly(3-hydroxyalkanoate) depolymerase [Candidatus Dormibacteria bacterium]
MSISSPLAPAGGWERSAQVVTVDGVRLQVSSAGRGGTAPLVLISGIGAPLELWDPFRRALGITTIAVDPPGVGGSATLRRPRSMWGIAGLMDRLLDRLGYQTVDVLGLSWGGGVAQHLALRRGTRVRRLVLASTGFGLGSIPADPRAMFQLLTPARYFSPSHFLQVAPSLYGGETRRHPQRLHTQAAVRSARRPSGVGYFHQLAAASTWVALPLLPFIRNDTLVITGDDDPIVHVRTARIMAALLPRGRLRIVPGAGHLFLIDQAGEAADIVGRFLGDEMTA